MAKRKPKPKSSKQPKRQEKPAEAGGRPTDYRAEFCDVAISACARGATIATIAEMLGVHRATIYRWMAEHQEFCDAIRVAREIADELVGFSLYERAVGYTYDAVKILQNNGVPLVVPYREHVPPDVAAQKHWLANRQPDKWREVSKIEHTGKNGDPIEFAGSEHDAARRIAFMLGKAVGRVEARTKDASIGS